MTVYGVTAGTFDLCHVGHISFLNLCQEACDDLYVLVQVDPSKERPHKGKPVQSIFERFVQIINLTAITSRNVYPYETENDLRNFIATFNEGDRIKLFVGEDHKNDVVTGSDLPGTEVVFIPRNHNYSSRELKTRIFAQGLLKNV